MAENSRKNEFFERESIAIIAITTNSSIRVNGEFFFIFQRLSSAVTSVTMWTAFKSRLSLGIKVTVWVPAGSL